MKRSLLILAPLGLALAWACAATDKPNEIGSDDDGSTTTTAGPGGGDGGSGATTSQGGNSGGFNPQGGSGQGGDGGIFMNPCGSECGPEELCGAPGTAIDDDCDGQVDEECGCSAGSVQACFKGDPSLLGEEGCFPGTQSCTELGTWTECTGGVHATENCAEIGTVGCHAITSPPFVTADLGEGTGNFSDDAISETFEVTCPAGVDPCPTPNGANYTPLQSGEYSVTYTKTTANGDDTCTFPLFVGAPGLRVELQWDWVVGQGSDTVDLDLHVHKPQDSNPWGGSAGNEWDCAYNNCTASAYSFGFGVEWFNGAAPPDPVSWYEDPVMENNTCYYGPKGNGAEWQGLGMGCHNPRLDIDNIFCDPAVTDPQNSQFCNPENINIDFPPTDQWTRIGVHYYSAHGQTYDVRPVVKIFCDGQLAAELGPHGYYTPEADIVFPASDGSDRFWLVADVLFKDDECEGKFCIVEPIYADAPSKVPLLTTDTVVTGTVGPSYPPIP